MLRNYLMESFYNLKNDIRSSLKGKVDKFTLSNNHLTSLLKDNPLFEDTIYLNDPATFYLFSESSLITADHDSHILYYFIKTPRIITKEVTQVYQTFNMGWERDNLRYKLGIPEYLSVLKGPKSYHPVKIDYGQCNSNRQRARLSPCT